MNLTLQLTLVALAACLVAVEGAPDGRLPRTKQQRPTRGFKNVEMMTARGFGKRDRPAARPERDVEYTSEEKPRSGRATPRFKSPSVGVARDFGKRDSEDEEHGRVPRREFKPKTSLMVGLDFGKRSPADDDDDDEDYVELKGKRQTFNPGARVLIARGFGKRDDTEQTDEVYGLDNFWESLETTPEREVVDADDKTVESIPLEWFVHEVLGNPDFARSVVRKFIDLNQDGMLSSEELLRNV
ncbi:unnamed protein product [Plutella xylostella]|uniref:(diamondback moth) hypothetical protein n=1 Tax=Plutella xylostella TaxID=51655 RepID=A0A8S4CYU3_PLUXY|nr:unnamed protein product [Plutella xylostella]